jgi:hypothetical protein
VISSIPGLFHGPGENAHAFFHGLFIANGDLADSTDALFDEFGIELIDVLL